MFGLSVMLFMTLSGHPWIINKEDTFKFVQKAYFLGFFQYEPIIYNGKEF